MTSGLARALSLFTIVPVRAGREMTAAEAARAVLWLPVIGAVLGGVSGLPSVAVRHWQPHASAVGAVISVALLVVLTRALHLDGLADTADGLGSRASAERALQIMRQSDIGPFGVVTVVLILGAEIASVAVFPGNAWGPCAAFAVAGATGRLAVVHAALRQVRPARPDGFGALVAGSVSATAAIAVSIVVLGAGAGLAAWTGANPVWWAATQAVALAAAWLLRVHATRRFGGMTGDVFGALIEIGSAITLVGLTLR